MATPSKRTRITNQTKEDIKKDSKKPGFKIEDAMKMHEYALFKSIPKKSWKRILDLREKNAVTNFSLKSRLDCIIKSKLTR